MAGRDQLDHWLDLAEDEQPIEPDLPIIDAHHHIWDRGGHRYLAQELTRDLDCGHNFLATIFVECLNAYRNHGPEKLRPIGESEFVDRELGKPLSTARGKVAAAQGIVARADLGLGAAVEDILVAHEIASEGRLRGVRYATAWHDGDAIRGHYPTHPDMLGLPNVREGIAKLGEYGLVFDVWAYFTQLEEVALAADACADTLFVINHCGAPIGIGPWRGRREIVYDQWKKSLTEVSRRQNVRIKLGGLGMPLTGFDFYKRPTPPSSDQLAISWSPYVETCIELFGASRAMFESNWPVDRTAGRYGTIWNAFKRTVAGASKEERQQLFAGVARQTYRLADSDAG